MAGGPPAMARPPRWPAGRWLRGVALLAFGLAGIGCGGAPEASPALGAVVVEPYVAEGEWAEALRRCLAVGAPGFEPCTFGELPPLGRGSRPAPTESELAGRLLVGAPWMGDHFMDLVAASPDALGWTGSITGVVIGVGVAPSFLSLRTGAVYLDPRHLARTPEEEESVRSDSAEDPRADMGGGLTFAAPWRYVRSGSVEEPVAASIQAAATLYHELAHALDQFPLQAVAAASDAATPWSFAQSHREAAVSAELPAIHPLRASRLFDLTRVTVDGEAPTPEQLGYAASDVAADLEADGATDLYAYHSPQEDLALLVEEFQMQRRLNTLREVRIEDASGALVWGQIGRIGAPVVRTRLRWVLGRLLTTGLDEALAAVDALPRPTSARP